MKIFLLDDSDTLGQYISRQSQNNPIFEIYWPSQGEEAEPSNLDDYFSKLLNEAVWQKIDQQDGSCQKIMTLLAGSDCNLFLININLKFKATAFRQDQDGVELLKHIRLTEELGEARNFHVALYSFEEPLELLESKPGNLMILSKGVSFHRLPEYLPNWTEDNLSKLAGNRATVNKDFQRFVQCDYQPPDSAHQFSNWWGINQIIDARTVMGLPSIKAPSVLHENLIKLENKKVLFLNSHSDSSRANQMHEGDFNKLREAITLRPGQENPKLHILYIDDEEGWGKTLSAALECDFQNLLKVTYYKPAPLVFSTSSSINEWIDSILQENLDVSMILLDLRLLGSNEMSEPVEKASGISIAKILRESHPGLPILLCTASNKAQTFEAAMKFGIDGYWMKEGIGEHSLQDGRENNYLHLLKIITNLLGYEYQFLRRFSDSVIKLKGNNGLWWRNSYEWIQPLPGGGKTSISITLEDGEKNDILKILDGLVILLREYMKLFVMGYGFRGESSGVIERRWIAALITESFKIVEAIHKVNENGPGNTVNYAKDIYTKERNDNLGDILRKQRNASAHLNSVDLDFKFEHAQSMLAGIVAWLNTDPAIESPERINFLGNSCYKYILGSQPKFHMLPKNKNLQRDDSSKSTKKLSTNSSPSHKYPSKKDKKEFIKRGARGSLGKGLLSENEDDI